MTSPESEPEKVLAVVAVAAWTALAAVVALPLKLPAKVPLKTLPAFVATVTPAKLFVPVNAFVPLSRAIFAESCASDTLPLKFVAVVAVAALPLILMAAVPALKLAGFKPVRPEPLPLKEPFKLAAVMVEAEKLPEASRCTIVLAVFVLVAPLAARAPLATFAAVCPPTLATTVAP